MLIRGAYQLKEGSQIYGWTGGNKDLSI